MSTYEISKSSLLSLKAEILRKKEDLSKAKADNAEKIKVIKKKAPLELKNKGVEERQSKDLNAEEEDLLSKSRSVLEAKSKLYDELASSKGGTKEQIELKKRYLVRFDCKEKGGKNDDRRDCDTKYSDDDDIIEDYEAAKHPDEEWVEYTDYLGRTRTCLKKDLHYLKSQEKHLKRNDHDDHEEALSEPEKFLEEPKEPSEPTEKELISGDMRREMLRRQWEEEEEELKNKNNIHYQDILFNEARTHGVGYYGFSKDEEERARQQKELKNLREATKKAQDLAEQLKAKREKQLAARLRAAQNRKRARMGLPPLEDNEEEAKPLQLVEPEEKLNEEDIMKQKLLEEARRNHIRPWDIGKEGLKKHYEYSQDEWVEKKREERIDEFAPPSAYRKDFRSRVLSPSPERREEPKTLHFTSRKSLRSHEKDKKHQSINPYKISKDETDDSGSDVEDDSLLKDYYSTQSTNSRCDTSKFSKDNQEHVKTSNQNNLKEEEKVEHIVYADDDPDLSASSTRSFTEDNVTKTTYLAFADNDTRKVLTTHVDSSDSDTNSSSSKKPKLGNIEESVEAGLKFLRQQVEHKRQSKRRKEDMFLF